MPLPSRRRRFALFAVPAVLSGLAIAACGTPSPDLFILDRTGDVAGARLHLRVQDGGELTCNGKSKGMITSAQLITSRELVRELAGGDVDRQNDVTSDNGPLDRNLSLPPGPNSVFRYRLRAEEGTIAFSDDSKGQPKAFYKLAVLVRGIAKGPCGLPR